MPPIPEITLQPDTGLGAIRTMSEFRSLLQTDELTRADRLTLVEQARVLIDGLYVHLLHKRAMYASDPSQRLRLLRQRLAGLTRPELTEPEFHARLLQIFNQLRDLHTNYILPSRFHGPFAFLGILLEQHWRDGAPRWIVSKVWRQLTGDTALVAGVEVTHWNGSPMALALARHAEQEAGSNPAARLARGLENMTFRPFAMSPPPDEDWVDLTYLVGDTTHETRIPWRVFDSIADLPKSGDDEALARVGTPTAHLVGVDLRTELVRRVKAALFAAAGGPEPDAAAAGVTVVRKIDTVRPELQARILETSHGTFGHLRIFTFHMEELHQSVSDDIWAFIDEVAAVLAQLPKDGLIIDVRGNGGGYVFAAEYLLQFFTPRRIQPEPMQFINTQATAELCAQDKEGDFSRWSDSISESIQTGAQYSSALSLYSADGDVRDDSAVNDRGQLYHGPVVLITDALCYSATDIFAGGFQDHEIGPVLGVDDSTGAGGANVLTHKGLAAAWPDGPLKPLPAGAEFRVALRRTLRVGKRTGQVVEDFGVLPTERHLLTKRDLLEGNVDLMERAGALLAALSRRVLDVGDITTGPDGTDVTIVVTTEGLSSLDVYANGRPVDTAVVLDGINQITVPLTKTAGIVLRIDGFDNEGKLVASRTVTLTK